MPEKLLVVIPGYIPTVDIVVQSLQQMNPKHAIEVKLSTKLTLRDIFSEKNSLLFVRACNPSLYPLLSLMRWQSIPYLYYLDDNLWEITGDTPLARAYAHPQVRKTLTTFVRQAHSVIAGSEELKRYIEKFNSNVYSVNAGFDFSLLENLQQESSDKIKILYAGSLYRDRDFVSVIPALRKISQEYEDRVAISFYGYTPDELKGLKNVYFDKTFYEYGVFIKKQFQTGFDIGLAPLSDSLSNRCKTNLKYREYSACGIAGVYSNVPPYTDCIINHENGVLVDQNTESWYEAIKSLIEQSDLRKKIIQASLADVGRNYTHAQIAVEWAKIINQLPAKNEKISRVYWRGVRVKINQKQKLMFYKASRVKDYYQYYGLIPTCRKIVRSVWLRAINRE